MSGQEDVSEVKRGRGRPSKAKVADEQVLFVRAPLGLIGRIDAHLDRLKQKNPAFRLHRSDVVRSLIERAVSIEENEARVEIGGEIPGRAAGDGAGRGSFDLIVMDAVHAAATGTPPTVTLTEVYARCRGIPRREYEDALRRLERDGVLALERAPGTSALTDDDRAAAIIDQRGTLTVAVLVERARAGDKSRR